MSTIIQNSWTHGINLDSRPWPKAKQGLAKGQKALAEGQKALAEGQSPPQGLEVSPRSGLFLHRCPALQSTRSPAKTLLSVAAEPLE